MLAKKTMHDEERRTNEKPDVKKISCSEDKDSRTDHNKKNKTIKSKINKKGKERKEDGMKEEERRCSSAPGFREDEHGEQLLEPGNLTAPVTPRFNALTNDTRKSAGKTSRVYTPTRSTTPRGFVSPDLRIIEQDTEVVLELRGDRIETASYVKDFRVGSTPTSRVGTPCRLDWQGRITEQGTYPVRPKIRSTIREVPCALKRSEKTPKEPPKFEIRAVGFSLPFHEKSESNSAPRTKKKNDPKVIKIPRAEGEEPSMLSLPTVTVAVDTSRDEEKSPKSETDSAKESTPKENNNSQENEQTESKEITKVDSNDIQKLSNDNTGNEQKENAENMVKTSEKPEELLIKKLENENGKENGSGNENGNEMNDPETENETDITKDEKKKKTPTDKNGGRRNSKNKGRKK